jgi:hypothetical protein
VSDRELARTVKDRKIVHFFFSFDSKSSSTITGFVCGWDSYHWKVVSPDGQVHLIHKGSLPLITIGDRQSLSDVVEQVVQPFRRVVLERFFGQ